MGVRDFKYCLLNSSSFSTPQNREKKKTARYEVSSPNKNHNHVRLVFETRAKILTIVSPRGIAGELASLAFEAIETIIYEITNRLSSPDRLEIFWNDRGGGDDPDDHMETRLYDQASYISCSTKYMQVSMRFQ